ncbi:MAG: thioesterase family protein [Eubacterium sp.]|nr:thioesterase family protein [Eubacterium sp.]
MQIETGVKNTKELTVTDELTAAKMGSGLAPVYATPCMIALIEGTAAESVETFLEEGQGTVGTKVEVEHLAATPVGMKVRCETELIEVDRKRLLFKAEVYDETGLVGKGQHERFIIDNARFMEKVQAKLKQ